MFTNANKSDIDEIMMEAIKRKRELYPDYDLVYMAIPKNDFQEHK